MDKKAIVFEILRSLSIVIGQEVTQERLALLTKKLSDEFELNQIEMAVAQAELKFTRFPSYAELHQLIQPIQDKRENANEMASRIVDAIRQFGWNNYEQAERHLGPECWFAVRNIGGWRELCNTKTKDMPIVRAQLRDICAMSMTAIDRVDEPRDNLLKFQTESLSIYEDLIDPKTDTKLIEGE